MTKIATKILLALIVLPLLTSNCSNGSNQANSNNTELDPFANLDVTPCDGPSDCNEGDSCSTYGICLTPCTETQSCESAGSEFNCSEDGFCVTESIAAAMQQYDIAHGVSNKDSNVQMVGVNITGNVVLSKNYPKQIRDLFYATFNSGSKMARGRLFVKYCEDADCQKPLALVMASVQGMDDQGIYMYSTGFPKDFFVDQAPAGKSFAQVILDTQFSVEQKKGACTNQNNCPGDADVMSTNLGTIEVNSGGNQQNNPLPVSQSLSVTEGASISMGSIYLGSIRFSGKELWTAPTKENGKVLVATSNDEAPFRNRIAIMDLATYSVSDESYTLQLGNSDFPGDICGLVQGDSAVYAIGVDSDGAKVFELNTIDGQQDNTDALAKIDHPDLQSGGALNAEKYPWPCRGIYQDGHLYLVQFKGAGSLTTSIPYAFYDVDTSTGDVVKSADYTSNAFRGVATDSSANTYFVDMSWSKDSTDKKINKNRLYQFDGVTKSKEIVTGYTSNDKCDSNLNWATGLKSITTPGGDEVLLMGHDSGIAVYDTNLTELYNIDLKKFGRLFGDMQVSPDGKLLYAMPQCKADNAFNDDYALPQGAGLEKSDRNLVAILDITGDKIQIADTKVDPNSDGVADNGIDLDYWFLKDYIRSFQSTLPIPPVVYTGPQMAVSQKSLFVRGTGIQGNGSSISSSGMGQVQDIGVFNLTNGRGYIFKNYMPFFDGLSSGAGKDSGQWGFDLGEPKIENSTGALIYLAGPSSSDKNVISSGSNTSTTKLCEPNFILVNGICQPKIDPEIIDDKLDKPQSEDKPQSKFCTDNDRTTVNECENFCKSGKLMPSIVPHMFGCVQNEPVIPKKPGDKPASKGNTTLPTDFTINPNVQISPALADINKQKGEQEPPADYCYDNIRTKINECENFCKTGKLTPTKFNNQYTCTIIEMPKINTLDPNSVIKIDPVLIKSFEKNNKEDSGSKE